MKKHFSSYWIRSAFYTFLQRFSITIFGFINFALLTRSLTRPQFGIWVLFLTITGIFETAKVNLLKNAHVKYVSGTTDLTERTTIASSSFVINLAISLVFILLIFFFSNWLGDWLHIEMELAVMLKWFVPGLICMVFFSHFEAVQQSHLDFKGIFAGYFIRQIVFFLIILTYTISRTPLSLTHLVMYQSLSIAIGSIILYLSSKKYLVNQFTASWRWIKKIIGYGGYIFGSGMVANIYSNLDQLMIAKFMKAPDFVASYGVASRINSLVDIPSYAAADIIFPKASRASVEEGQGKVTYLFERMVAILIAINIPITLFIILFAKFITVTIASNTYSASVPILQLYMVASIFRPVQNQAANLLNSIGKPRIVFFINSSTLIALLGINYLCLLQFGFYGVAIGTLITSLLGFIAWYIVMKKQVNMNISNVARFTLDTYKLIYNQVMGIIRRSKTDQSMK